MRLEFLENGPIRVEYKRVRVRVETEEGPLEAWAYLYLGGLEGALPLPQGVWKG